MKCFALYYKDKEGFDLPYSNMGQLAIYTNENLAESAKKAAIEKFKNELNPKHEYSAKRSFFGKKTVIKIDNSLKDEWAIELINRQINTLYVKAVNVY